MTKLVKEDSSSPSTIDFRGMATTLFGGRGEGALENNEMGKEGKHQGSMGGSRKKN